MTTQKVKTHWILGDEVIPHNWLSKLNYVTPIIHNPSFKEMQQFKQFYGYDPEVSTDIRILNKSLEQRTQDTERVLLLQPNFTTNKSITPWKELLNAINIPFTFVGKRYFPSQDGHNWNDKGVVEKLIQDMYPQFCVPDRKFLDSEQATDYIGELLRTHEKVAVQHAYSKAGFGSKAYDTESYKKLVSGEENLPLAVDQEEGGFLVAPYFKDHISLSSTAVIADGTIETFPVRYQTIENLGFRGSKECKVPNLQERCTEHSIKIASSISNTGYEGFLNFDWMILQDELHLSEINFRVPLSFFLELLLREKAELNPELIFHPQQGKNVELYSNAIQGLVYLCMDKII